MIQKFVNKFMDAKPTIEAELRAAHPAGYDALVRRVVELTSTAGEEYDDRPDPDRITTIDHGEYQGTRLYIIGAQGYQPSTYWSVFVAYGSCSTCDTFESIRDYSDDAPNEQQVADYWTLMLHMVQSMRELGKEVA
jgi:hypothetical protein